MEAALNRHKPLYLKYRPQTLAELVGQSAVQKTLANAIGFDRLSHAYLFTGPRGTGKTSTARILAKSLNCETGPTATPCLQCTQCREIGSSTSPAVFEIDAASNNSVDDARVLIERAPLVAVGGRFKLYIIDECHMLTREAFNALLKTIEEPPAKVVFVLATTEEHKVPPTIVSRCQRLMFRLVNQEELSAYLRQVAEKESIEIEDAALSLIARRSGGGLRDAMGLLDQASLLSRPGQPVTVNELLALLGAVHEDMLLEISEGVARCDGKSVLSAIERLLTEGREPAVLAMELARHFLNLTKASYLVGADKPGSSTAPLLVGSRQYIDGLTAQAAQTEPAELAQIVEQLSRLEQTCRRTTQPALHLEMGLLSVCHRHDIVRVRHIEERLEKLEGALSGQSFGAATLAPRADRVPAAQRSEARDAPRPAPAAAKSAGKPSSAEAAAAAAGTDAASQTDDGVVGEPGDASGAPAAAEAVQSSAVTRPLEAAGDNQEESAAFSEPALADESPVDAAAGIEPSMAEDDDFQSDLELFWSQLLDELKSSPSIHGVLSSFPFPLELNGKEFTIGVPTDMWKSNVERRLEPIKAACEQIRGSEMSVRVKVVTAPARRSGPRSRESSSVGAATRKSSDSDSPEAEPAGNGQRRGGALSRDRQRNGSTPARQEVPGGPRVVSGKEAEAVADAAPGSETGSTTVREAYKLFEGPGSRLIG